MFWIDQYLPITRAKAGLLNLVRRVKNDNYAVAITRNGVPEAVMLSLDRFDGLLETIEILSDQRGMKVVRQSIGEAENGKWINAGELLADD